MEREISFFKPGIEIFEGTREVLRHEVVLAPLERHINDQGRVGFAWYEELMRRYQVFISTNINDAPDMPELCRGVKNRKILHSICFNTISLFEAQVFSDSASFIFFNQAEWEDGDRFEVLYFILSAEGYELYVPNKFYPRNTEYSRDPGKIREALQIIHNYFTRNKRDFSLYGFASHDKLLVYLFERFARTDEEKEIVLEVFGKK